MSDFFNRVYEFVKQVPKGKVTTYGGVARAIGAPRASRQVGWALHYNPQPGVIPCHRVVFRDGSLTDGFAFGGRDVQKAMLLNEGVAFITISVRWILWREYMYTYRFVNQSAAIATLLLFPISCALRKVIWLAFTGKCQSEVGS